MAVFKSVKQKLSATVHEWRMKHTREVLTSYNFAELLQSVFNDTMKKETIQKGLRRCSLFPWNNDAVDYSKLDIINVGAV